MQGFDILYHCVSDQCGCVQVCSSTLSYHNSTLMMSVSGAKGSPINIAQMVGCVGQQSVGGKRCPDGFQVCLLSVAVSFPAI